MSASQLPPRKASHLLHPRKPPPSFASSDTETLRRNPVMSPPSRSTVLDKLSSLRARALKKVRSRPLTNASSQQQRSQPSDGDDPPDTTSATSSSETSPVAVNSVPHTTATAPSDGLWESLHIKSGAITCPCSIGAATTAGVELTIDPANPAQHIRTRKTNQDCFGVTTRFADAPDGLLACVYDGHGMEGRECSYLVRDMIPRVLRQALLAHVERCGGMGLREALSPEERRRAYVRLFTKAFTEAEKELCEEVHEIHHRYSGTTATCMWMDGSELFVAWAGDSRAIMGRRNEIGEVETVDLTWDQKPARVDEKKRVRAAGGRVTRWKKNMGPQRVWLPDEWMPGLAMTRSIGDTVLSPFGVFPTPEVTVTRLSTEESFVVAASDGVWEFMSSEEVGDFVARARVNGSCAESAARELVNEAVRRWGENESVVDDTTAIVMYIERNTSLGQKGSHRLGRGREDGNGTREFENRSFRDVFRGRRLDFPREAQVGQPWSVATSGKLEPFCPENDGAEVLEEDGGKFDGIGG